MPEEDFFEAYFSFIGDCEVPKIYIRWCAVAGIGAVLARQFWLGHGSSDIYPNHYIMLIGNPGTRKDTGIGQIRKAINAAGYTKIAATRTTKERFIMDLEGLPLDGSKLDEAQMQKLLSDSEDEVHDMFVMAGEFGEFTGYGNAEFISLLTALWDNLAVYDGRTKNSRSVMVHKPTVSILGGNTHSGFALTFPTEVIGQGFLSRVLLIYADPTSKRIAWPRIIRPAEWEILGKYLKAIQLKVHGEASITQEARDALAEIYETWTDLEDVRFRHYSNRRHTHLLKLCLVCAAARISTEITVPDVIYANSILTNAENFMPRALGEFGKGKHADVAAKVLDFLDNTNAPATIPDIWKVVSTDLDKIADLAHIIANLEQADKIQRIASKGFLPKKKPPKQDSKYIDYSLLREWQF